MLKLEYYKSAEVHTAPAAFRRLCVETVHMEESVFMDGTSRLQAAVC